MPKVTAAVLGAGDRGWRAYGEYILKHPGEIKAVAVAEPNKEKRKRFAEEHGIKERYQFNSWEKLLAKERLADGIIVATPDLLHVKPAVKALEKGYKILLEKPIAPDWKGTEKLAAKAKEEESSILVAHVLRYTNFYQRLKEILEQQVVGRLRFIDHVEKIGFFHFAHSYVRGNWRNTEVAAPIILAKSCHDLDLLYWLAEKKCVELTSRASLEYFTAANQPKEAAARCLDCPVEEDCPYSAQKIYLTEKTDWPVSVISTDLSYQGRYQALSSGPYGRCIYKCDNNVPEVQTVGMKFEDNLEVNFTLTAFSNEITRVTNFFGSRGEIRADFKRGEIKIFKFGKGEERIKVKADSGGHGGGDTALMNQYVNLLQGNESGEKLTTLESSLESHRLAFAAEEARNEKRIVKMREWRR